MDNVSYRGRDYRRELRRRSSDHLHRKYSYRGVKTAIGFVALGALALYLLYNMLGSLVNFLT